MKTRKKLNSEKTWRAFYVRPRHEKKAKERLEERGFEIYCPLIQTKVKWSDRWKKVKKPAVPGYIFAKVTEPERLGMLEDPSVLNTVFWNREPATVREEEIEAMRILLGEAEQVSVQPVSRGDKVAVDGGAFRGVSGVVVDVVNKTVRILLESLQCELILTVPVERLQILSGGDEDTR